MDCNEVYSFCFNKSALNELQKYCKKRHLKLLNNSLRSVSFGSRPLRPAPVADGDAAARLEALVRHRDRPGLGHVGRSGRRRVILLRMRVPPLPVLGARLAVDDDGPEPAVVPPVHAVDLEHAQGVLVLQRDLQAPAGLPRAAKEGPRLVSFRSSQSHK